MRRREPPPLPAARASKPEARSPLDVVVISAADELDVEDVLDEEHPSSTRPRSLVRALGFLLFAALVIAITRGTIVFAFTP